MLNLVKELLSCWLKLHFLQSSGIYVEDDFFMDYVEHLVGKEWGVLITGKEPWILEILFVFPGWFAAIILFGGTVLELLSSLI